jgi:ferredoxin
MEDKGYFRTNIAKKLVPKKTFLEWLDSLRNSYRLIGPVLDGKHTAFKEVASSREFFMGYKSTMLSPGKLFLYRPKEELLRFTISEKITIDEIQPATEKQIIVGVHPCDTHAILYLDRTFLGSFEDPYYKIRRENTLIISLNCNYVSENCFCSSVGTGPFLNAKTGYDILLTDFESDYLVEIKSRKAEELFSLRGKEAGANELRLKPKKEKSLLNDFKKKIDIGDSEGLFRDNISHPVWERTADERCLSCSNCVMVCPTCFCYDIVDEVSMDMETVTRHRYFDACLDAKFAEVHGGNFRQRRAARLRQFVTHKLDQKVQYGVAGTVGCGRCITWCPTGIDLTEIVKEMHDTRYMIQDT